jgi:hypothetical protein
MQVTQLDTAHPAARRILVGAFDGIVSHFVAGAARSTSATPSRLKSAASAGSEECLEVRYLV